MIQRCPCLLRWPIDPEEDSYCGFCGRRLRSVEWKIDYSGPFYIGCEEVIFTLTLYNTGILPVEISGLDWYPSEENAYTFSECVKLLPEHPYSEMIRLPVPPTLRNRSKLLIKIRTQISYRSDLVEINLQNKPRIDVVSLSEFSVVLVEVPESWEIQKIPLTVKVQEADIVLKDVDPVRLVSRDPKVTPVSVFLGASYEKVWKNQQEVELQIEIPRRLFPSDPLRGQADVRLEMDQKQGGPVVSRWFTVRLCVPLRMDLHLDYLNQKRARVLKGERNRFRMILEKKGGGGLTIQNLTVYVPTVFEESGLTALLTSDRQLPLYLTGVTTEIGWLELDAVRWNGSPRDTAPIRVEVELEDGRKENLYINADVIEPVRENIAPLAVDFGNTYTAVAEGTPGNRPAVVNLGPLATTATKEFKSIAPTLVLYEPEISAGTRDRYWDAPSVKSAQIGINAFQLLTANPMNGAKIAAAFKPNLGMNRDFRFAIMPNVRKTVESIAVDYLRAVLNAVVLETGKQHRNIIITHPVRFWSTQREALRNVVLTALQDSNRRILFLDEASAVVIYDTYKRITSEKQELSNSVENVFVFDFGGGSIDLTLYRVSYLPNQRLILMPIAYDGTNNFGGDHITQFLSDDLYHQAKAGLNGQSKGKKDLDPAHRWDIPFLRWDWIDYTKSPIYIHYAVQNYINAYVRAESFKVNSLSDFHISQITNSASPAAPVSLYYWDEQTDNYQSRSFMPEFSIEGMEAKLRGELQRPVQLVRRMLEDLKQRSAEFRLDRVILSGQSSRLRVVPTLLLSTVREFFPGYPEEKIIHIEEAKEAVALGGVVYGIIERRVNMEISRLSRSYLFLERPAGFFGASAYLPVIHRLDALPKTVEIPLESFDEPEGLSLRYGDRLMLLESFCNLADPVILETAQPDEDYRAVAEILVIPEGWREEWVETAHIRFTYSEDEQAQVQLVPETALQETVEPYLLWPRNIV